MTTKRTTWYIDEDLLYDMKRLALDNRTTLTDIANQAFREFVGKKGVTSSYSNKDVKTFAKDLKAQVDRIERKRMR